MTHVRPNELLGKKAYDGEGRLLGEVVGIAGRHGKVRAVIVRCGAEVHRLPQRAQTPRLRVLQ